jgi:hypothetical protein
MLTEPIIIAHEGAEALGHAYLQVPDGPLRFLSLGGPTEAVKAVLAALATQREVACYRSNGRGRHTDTRWLFTGPEGHRTLVRKLPSGQVHGILYPEDALPGSPGSTFTLLLPEPRRTEAAACFFRLLAMRTPLPLHPSWAGWLWATFEAQQWLTALEGVGPWIGWEAAWEEKALVDLVRKALRKGGLAVPQAGTPALPFPPPRPDPIRPER